MASFRGVVGSVGSLKRCRIYRLPTLVEDTKDGIVYNPSTTQTDIDLFVSYIRVRRGVRRL